VEFAGELGTTLALGLIGLGTNGSGDGSLKRNALPNENPGVYEVCLLPGLLVDAEGDGSRIGKPFLSKRSVLIGLEPVAFACRRVSNLDGLRVGVDVLASGDALGKAPGI
jgi:hypothetical protein